MLNRIGLGGARLRRSHPKATEREKRPEGPEQTLPVDSRDLSGGHPPRRARVWSALGFGLALVAAGIGGAPGPTQLSLRAQKAVLRQARDDNEWDEATGLDRVQALRELAERPSLQEPQARLLKAFIGAASRNPDWIANPLFQHILKAEYLPVERYRKATQIIEEVPSPPSTNSNSFR